jgi:hypothetical protein
MLFSSSESDVRNHKHACSPQPGDYWSEHLVGVCVVLKVDEDSVTFCRQRVDVDDGHWTWDLHKQTRMTRDQFKKWLSYDSPGMQDQYWADVMPNRHGWAVKEAAKLPEEKIELDDKTAQPDGPITPLGYTTSRDSEQCGTCIYARYRDTLRTGLRWKCAFGNAAPLPAVEVWARCDSYVKGGPQKAS